MATAYQTTPVRRDSDLDPVDYKETPEPYERTATSSSVTNDSTVDRRYNKSSTYAMKRTLSNASFGSPDASGYTAKKGKYNKDDHISISSTKQVRRVLCPFFIENPNMDEHRVSCYNKGFNEMASLKQHLVKEHKVPSADLNYFKDKSFRSLATLEAKWTRVFRTLFPNIKEDDVASPCKYVRRNTGHGFTYECVDKPAVSFSRPSATTLSASPASPCTALNDCKRSTSILCDLLHTNKLSTTQNSGLPTPPSSTETSPELGNLDTTLVVDFEAHFPPHATIASLGDCFVDPPLFEGCNLERNQYNSLTTLFSSAETSFGLQSRATAAAFEAEQLFPSLAATDLFRNNLIDTPLFSHANTSSLTFCSNKAAPDAVPLSSEPTITCAKESSMLPTACLACRSANIRQTWGKGPFIWVCYDCACTDMDWSVVTNVEDSLRCFDTEIGDGMPALVGDLSPAVAGPEMSDLFMGAAADMELNLDEWILEEHSYGDWACADSGKMYSDEFFDFGEFDEIFKI